MRPLLQVPLPERIPKMQFALKFDNNSPLKINNVRSLTTISEVYDIVEKDLGQVTNLNDHQLDQNLSLVQCFICHKFFIGELELFVHDAHWHENRLRAQKTIEEIKSRCNIHAKTAQLLNK